MLSHFLRGFSIRTRMLGAIGVVLVLLAVLAGAGYVGIQAVRHASETYLLGSSVRTQQLSQLQFAVARMAHRNDGLANALQRPELTPEALKEWEAAKQGIDLAVAALQRDGTERAAVEEIARLLSQHQTGLAPIVERLKANDPAVVSELLEARDRANVTLAQAQGAMIKLGAAFEQQARVGSAQFNDQVKWTLMAFAFVTALAAVIVVPTTLANMHSICEPIKAAREFADEVAQGNLTRRLQVVGRDETADLQRSLLAMQASLSRLVGSIRHATDSINTSSVEIASGNQDLSGRTEQTASALQQTASSMEQLTDGVHRTAESAGTAQQLAATASQAAQRGGDVVSQVVANMNDITSSSHKIGEIIGVIDGIAFQTNILALNAAVEAARAGEQGRGFAVVAGEVRSLAQRSANAAKEIKTLIGASVEKIESGSRLVQDAGAAMGEIVTGVRQVNDIIGQIASAAVGQSDELGQVNQAVSQLDQMTQQNAALVEQSAAAAESMREQATSLARAVEVFRVAPVAG